MMPLDSTSNDLGNPLLQILSQHTDQSPDKLLNIAKALVLSEAVRVIGKYPFDHEGLDDRLIEEISLLQKSELSPVDILEWAQDHINRLPESFIFKFSDQTGQLIRFGINDGNISEDLAEQLFKTTAKQFNAIADRPHVNAKDLPEWLSSEVTSTNNVEKYSAVALTKVKNKLFTVEQVNNRWQIVAAYPVSNAGWEPYKNGSRYSISGDGKRDAGLVLLECLKTAFNLEEDELDSISFHVFRRFSKAYTASLKEQLRQPYLKQYDIEVPDNRETESLYAELLSYPNRRRMSLLLENPNLLEIDHGTLDRLLPETPRLDPQEHFDSVLSPEFSGLRDSYNSLFLEPDDYSRIAILLKDHQLPMDDGVINTFSPEHRKALSAISTKALIHKLHKEAQPIQKALHAAVYKQMITLPLDRCINLLREKGITTLDEDTLQSIVKNSNAINDGVQEKIRSAFSTINPSPLSGTAVEAVYSQLTASDTTLAQQYLQDIEAWEIDKKALARFPKAQQLTIEHYFSKVQESTDEKAVALYNQLRSLASNENRVALIKEKGITQISMRILKRLPIEEQKKILEAFIPVAQDHHANEYLYRLILVLPTSERRQRLLSERNIWRIDEVALSALSIYQKENIKLLFDDTNEERHVRDLRDYETISRLEPVEARAAALADKGISRLNKVALNDLTPEQQLNVVTAFTHRLQTLIADTTPNDVVKALKPELIKTELERSKLSIPEPDALDDGELILGKRIGGGNQATVYEAMHSITGQIFAVKIFHSSHDEEEQAEIDADFDQEVAALSELPKHPNIMRYYGKKTFYVDGQPQQGIVIQHLKGVDLDIVLSQMLRLYAAGEILKHEFYAGLRSALEDVIDGLEAHGKARFVHKDIKGFNIKCTEDGTVVLLDEGRAERMDRDPSAFWENRPNPVADRFYPEDALGVIKLLSLLEQSNRLGQQQPSLFAPVTQEYETFFRKTTDEIADTEDATPQLLDEKFNSVLASATSIASHVPPGALSSLLKTLASVPPFSVMDFSPNAITDNMLFPIFRQAKVEPSSWGREFLRNQGDKDVGKRILQYAVESAQKEKKAREVSEETDMLPPLPDLKETSKQRSDSSLSDDEREHVSKLLARTQAVRNNNDAKKWEEERSGVVFASLEKLNALPGRSPVFRAMQLYKLDRLSTEARRKDDLTELQRIGDVGEKAYNNIVARLMMQFDGDEFNSHFQRENLHELMQQLNAAPNTEAVINARKALLQDFPSTIKSLKYRDEWTRIKNNTSTALYKAVSKQLSALSELSKRRKACEGMLPNPNQTAKLEHLLSTAERNIRIRLKQLDRGATIDQLAEIRESVMRWPARYKHMKNTVSRLEKDAQRQSPGNERDQDDKSTELKTVPKKRKREAEERIILTPTEKQAITDKCPNGWTEIFHACEVPHGAPVLLARPENWTLDNLEYICFQVQDAGQKARARLPAHVATVSSHNIPLDVKTKLLANDPNRPAFSVRRRVKAARR